MAWFALYKPPSSRTKQPALEQIVITHCQHFSIHVLSSNINIRMWLMVVYGGLWWFMVSSLNTLNGFGKKKPSFSINTIVEADAEPVTWSINRQGLEQHWSLIGHAAHFNTNIFAPLESIYQIKYEAIQPRTAQRPFSPRLTTYTCL